MDLFNHQAPAVLLPPPVVGKESLVVPGCERPVAPGVGDLAAELAGRSKDEDHDRLFLQFQAAAIT